MKHTGFIATIIVGAVSLTAFAAAAQGPGAKPYHEMSFQTLDADGNGEITREEMNTHHQARFSETDANGDGALSRAEMIEASVKRAGARADEMIEQFDANLDGLLTQDEMPKQRRSDKMFDRVDKDGNGSISQAEFDQAQTKMKGHKNKKQHSGKN
ncbi:EF-hand domain-containing protein [Sedimentitalea nanhaiensis]|uniref:EF hand n=1 Tax=Sedimentitalea nanhaiensis TaxID=999627 RepID=A0A1I7ARK9_9RHOB|nr:EF-hand domain-containing protein [Sedimentitalea nanhaiensis]SFT77537.1 EF hand [Sedimentitalea nanhaiensis]